MAYHLNMSSAQDLSHLITMHSELKDQAFNRKIHMVRLRKDYDGSSVIVRQAVADGNKKLLLQLIDTIRNREEYRFVNQSEWPDANESDPIEDILNTMYFYQELYYEDLFQ